MSDLPPQEATEEDTEFLDWLVDNGATFPKLMWPVYRWPGQPHDGERGVMVTEDIEPGECMFSIPSAVLLNREKCLASAIGGVFREHRAELFSDRDELALSLLIMYEKVDGGRDSFWRPMIESLPKSPGSAVLWGEEELSMFQDDVLRADALLKARSIAETHKKVISNIVRQHPEHFTADRYTLAEFQWALLCVESRTFGRFLPHPSITPFADLLNHVNVHTSYRWDPASRQAKYMCDDSGRFPHKRGCEAFMSYGPRANRELLLHYGFALENNKHDTLSLQFRVSSAGGGGVEKKKASLKTISVELRHARPCMIAVALFRGTTGALAKGPSRQVATDGAVVVNRNAEICALRGLKRAYRGVLRWGFPGGDKVDDVKVLAGLEGEGAMRKRFAVMYRMGRKRLIIEQARFVDEAINLLEEGQGEDVDAAYLLEAHKRWLRGVVDSADAVSLEDASLQDARAVKKEASPLLEVSSPVPVPGPSKFTSVQCGPDFTMALTAEGELWSWGGNEDGKLGHARTEFDISAHVVIPRRVEDLAGVRVVAASCGGQHCAVVTGDGQVFCWGSNSCGQCGLGYRCAQVLRATRVHEVSCKPSSEGALACGESFVLAVAGDGAVMAWGRNHEGQCGIGESSGAMGCVSSPSRVDSTEAFDRVWAGANHACGVSTGGELFSWGCGLNGTLGIGPVDDLPLDADGDPHAPSPMPTKSIHDGGAPPGGVVAAFLTDTVTLAVASDGSVVYAGYLPWEEDEVDLCKEGFAELGGAAAAAEVAKWGDCVALVGVGGHLRIARGGGDGKWHTILSGTRRVSAGHHHAAMLSYDGEIHAIGALEHGQLGVPLSMGFLSACLQTRVDTGTSSIAQGSHPGVPCSNCKSDSIKGIRYASVLANIDLCSKCLSQPAGAHIASTHPLVVCHRRLPKVYRPACPSLQLTAHGSEAEHGVECGACGAQVVGVRFMCGNCEDFSLCRECHGKPDRGCHPSSHLFLLLSSPISPPRGATADSPSPCLPNIFPQLAADVVVS